jgi:basic membrane protein A
MGKFVGDTVLASPVWNLETYYIATIQNVLNGTWKTHEFWGGLKDNTRNFLS